ncbi:MAG: histidine kinase [Azospirillum sp.]|nr:histidine kinase [Azospirillum sp.]
MRRYLPIGQVLLMMNLTALVLPVSGLWVLRVYESALIRQTESELIAQSAIIAAVFRSAWRDAGGLADATPRPAAPLPAGRADDEPPQLPRFPTLDLASDPIQPPPPEPQSVSVAPDPAARRAGEVLDPMLREAQLITLAGMRLVDRHGVVVASTGEALGQSLLGQEEVRRALQGQPVSLLRAKAGTRGPLLALDRGSSLRVFTALPVADGDSVIGVVLMSRTPRSIAEALYGKRWHLAMLAALLIGSMAALATLGTVAIARPLRTVIGRAKRTAEGERGVMIPVARPRVREIAELSEALTRMAATLEQRADYIRDFAAHVSHEFKTPLATIRGTVELLREHLSDMSAVERDRFLANLDAEAERLTRLVTRLLVLARADVAPPDERSGSVPAAVLARLVPRYRAQGLTIEVAGTTDRAVGLSEESLETVLANLLDNAVQHAGPGARVTIALDEHGDGVALMVGDDGPGISPANTERVFTPFFTTARRQGGTGLGLAIVHRLLAAAGASITLVPSRSGAGFALRLPGPKPGPSDDCRTAAAGDG